MQQKPLKQMEKNEKISIRWNIYLALHSNSEKPNGRYFFVKGSKLLWKNFVETKKHVIGETYTKKTL